MDRKYFFQLGGYDPGLQIWGGENFELSFKVCLFSSTVYLFSSGTKKLKENHQLLFGIKTEWISFSTQLSEAQ